MINIMIHSNNKSSNKKRRLTPPGIKQILFYSSFTTKVVHQSSKIKLKKVGFSHSNLYLQVSFFKMTFSLSSGGQIT